MEETRRTFCANACRAASAAALGPALGTVFEACSGSPTSARNAQNLPIVNGSFASGVLMITVDASSPLANSESLAIVSTSAGAVLVARTSATTFSALSAACTHAECTVSGFIGQTFVCPCHGSEFDVSGRVISGPAVVPLTTFKTAFVGTVLTIS